MANPDGEGLFLRVGSRGRPAEAMPADLREETEARLDRIHDDLDRFAQGGHGGVPDSVGHYFEVK